MNRHLLLALVMAVFFLSGWASGGNIGVSSECRNADCYVSASSSLLSILLAIGLAIFLVTYPQRSRPDDTSTVVGVWRRFGAFFLDCLLVMVIVSPLSAIPVLVSEASYSGTFQWAFERDHSRPTDSLYIFPGVLAGFLALFYYFYQHGRSGRPTVGQYVSSYRVTDAPDSGEPRYALRVVMSFLGLCMWPISVILALRNPNKAFWWDAATRTRVVPVVSR
jgi:hypothetical protein